MSNNIHLGGQFQVNVLNANGNLLRSLLVDNFITNVGVQYPFFYAFADCFRYLSLGTGGSISGSTGANMPATTGLSSGINAFSYIGSGNYVTGGFLGGGCGNFANQNSNTISLIRQWGLPDITGSVFQTGFNFSEIMVSPGRPYVTGFADEDNTIPTGLCTYLDLGYSYGSPNKDLTGLDTSQIAVYYSLLPQVGETLQGGGNRPRSGLCDAPYAFARITGNFNVNSGEILTITYKLNISFSTGIQSGTPFTSSNFDSANQNWASLGMFSNITNPGIKLIVDGYLSHSNPSILAPQNVRLQQFDYTNYSSLPNGLTNLYGESFVPSLGMPLEPSCINGVSVGANYSAYISDDNTQFLVSSTGSACNTGISKPWNSIGILLPQNSGLMKFQNQVNGNISTGAICDGSDSNYWFHYPYNIRQGLGYSSIGYPATGDITTTDPTISPGFFSGASPNTAFYIAGRSANINTSYQFPNAINYVGAGGVLYVKSFVVGYVDAYILGTVFPNLAGGGVMDSANVMPFFDCLFSGRNGVSTFLPTVQTGGVIGSYSGEILGAQNTEYNFLSGVGGYLYPTFFNQLTWTADCPSSVDGC